jgi:hypothetical protein
LVSRGFSIIACSRGLHALRQGILIVAPGPFRSTWLQDVLTYRPQQKLNVTLVRRWWTVFNNIFRSQVEDSLTHSPIVLVLSKVCRSL